MFKNNTKIIIFILNLLFFIKINGYIILDITDDYYGGYSQYAFQGYCNFNFKILCITNQSNETCSQLQFTNEPTSQTIIFANKSASVSEVIISQTIGTYSTIINSYLAIDLNCIKVDVNSISFKLYSNGYYYSIEPSYFGLTINAIYELNGLNDSIPPKNLFFTVSTDNSNFIHIYENKFQFQIYSTINSNNDLSNIKLKIFNDLNNFKEYNLESFYNNNNNNNNNNSNFFNQIYDIKTYPDLLYLNNLTLFGYGESAIIQFKSNITNFITPYIINRNGNSFDTSYYPVYSDNQSITYLFSMSSYNEPVDYSIIFQNGNTFDQLNSIIQTNITQFKFKNYPSSNFVLDPYYMKNDDILVMKVSFSDNSIYEFPPILTVVSKTKVLTKFPMGFTQIAPNFYSYEWDLLIHTMSYDNALSAYSIINGSGINSTFYSQVPYDSTNLPYVYSYEFIHLIDDQYLFKLNINSSYGFRWMENLNRNCYYGYESLVNGNQFNGIYEIIVSGVDINIDIYDIYDGLTSIFQNNILTLNPNYLKFQIPNYLNNFDIFLIKNVTFLYNNIDITNHRHYNIIYFNYSDIPRETIFYLKPNGIDNYSPIDDYDFYTDFQKFSSIYNYSIELFQIEFYIEANTQIGEFQFQLISNYYSIPNNILNNQLMIKNSNLDLMGPIFKEIKILNRNNLNEIGWSFLIQDLTNGFNYGFIIIKGELDQSIYNITLKANQDNVYSSEYQVKFIVEEPCVSQNYIISHVELYDKVNRKSLFSIFPPNSNYIGVTNPFLYFLNDTLINKLSLDCSNQQQLTFATPYLMDFKVTPNITDVGGLNRNVTFTFMAYDFDFGLKNYVYPIVYLSIANGKYIECVSRIVEINNHSANYTCNIELPLGFGYTSSNNAILLSVYGFVNNNGMASGFSTNYLANSGYVSYLTTTFSGDQLILTNHLQISERGGNLFLNGRNFESSLIATITFYDGIVIRAPINLVSSTTLYISNVSSTYRPYTVFLKSLNTSSNNLTIIPTIFDYFINESLPIPTTTPTPTSTPLPTNSPQSCPGNPICGGQSNGKCIENQGCVCNSPWIGNDCLSQIIIIDKPNINDTDPSTEIIVPGNNSSQTITYRSLISLVSIREIDISGNEIINIPFKYWIFKELDDTTFSYNTSLNIEKNNIITTTNISVTIKWFTNETTIKFANESLLMHASTMKYTINIDQYPFDNQLNQLQLIMSASTQSNSNKDDICSDKEFGDTSSGDNSNYLKIKINDHSLYGRFIKRGIIDDKIRSISNILLDSNFNSIFEPNLIQSYIGIQIPNFHSFVVVDPDFSVLIDTYSASSSCRYKSKLSSGKIIGIVLGCTAFISIIIVSIIYYYIKKSKDKKFKLNIKQKVSEMNNSTIKNDNL